jgi:hypothetical protein
MTFSLILMFVAPWLLWLLLGCSWLLIHAPGCYCASSGLLFLGLIPGCSCGAPVLFLQILGCYWLLVCAHGCCLVDPRCFLAVVCFSMRFFPGYSWLTPGCSWAVRGMPCLLVALLCFWMLLVCFHLFLAVPAVSLLFLGFAPGFCLSCSCLLISFSCFSRTAPCYPCLLLDAPGWVMPRFL